MKVDGALQNFNLKPARVLLQIEPQKDTLVKSNGIYDYCTFLNKKLIFVNKPIIFTPNEAPIKVDVLVLSNSPKIKIEELVAAISPTTLVFDGSNSLWKITQWKKACEELHLQYHSTIDDGAFILDAK